MNHTAIATINLSDLSHNLAETRRLLPHKKILAMIKSNAYGHGLVKTAKAFNDADAFGVATIAEALQLRAAGIEKQIVVMRGFVTSDELANFLKDPLLVACIHTPHQIKLLEACSFSQSDQLSIWLKIDTGMHRLGFQPKDFKFAYDFLIKLKVIQKPLVVCSHLADADNSDKTFTEKQIQFFQTQTAGIAMEKSLLNSAGILAYPEAAFDWIRPGLMLYGISPFALDDSRNILMKNFKPAMTLSSRLIALKDIEIGDKIGYCCTYTATQKMKIGIVGMGYGDSYPRQAKTGTPVLIQGKRCPIVGRVSMDMIAVDVSAVDKVQVDDEVILWNKDLLVSEIAPNANTISHELLCHLTGRVVLN